MRMNSIDNKIVAFFMLTILTIIAVSVKVISLQSENFLHSQAQKYSSLISSLNNQNISTEELNKYILGMDFEPVIDEDLIMKVMSKGEESLRRNTNIGLFYYFTYEGNLYLKLERLSGEVFIYLNTDKDARNIEVISILGMILSSFILFLLFLSIRRSILPLNKFAAHIKDLDLDSDSRLEPFVYKRKDEIGAVVQQFNRALSRIDELLKARKLFLRIIMHELKTPIGKGLILTGMLEDEKNKRRYEDIFQTLDLLINEFASVEKILSGHYESTFSDYRASDLIEQTKELLMFDDLIFLKKVKVCLGEQYFFHTDLILFSLILKNLIDNAIKYSSDRLCYVIFEDNAITVKNKGPALSRPFSYYTRPFSRDEGDENISGLGLGLYIIYQICHMHHFDLVYSYENDYHSFKILKHE